LKKERIGETFIEQSRPDTGMLVGRIVKIDREGQVYVDYQGSTAVVATARLTSSVQEKLRERNPEGLEVLLAFENNDPLRPIIVDTMYSLIRDIAENSAMVSEAIAGEEEIINSKRVFLDAGEVIVLKCGKASITLTSAGKILIRGEYVLSSARGSNKIKGGSIQLN